MTGWTEHRYAVVEVEGKGQHPPDLVELGVVPIEAGNIGKPVTWLCRPERPIAPIARRIHSIRNEVVAAAPPFAEVESDVRAHLDGPVLARRTADDGCGRGS